MKERTALQYQNWLQDTAEVIIEKLKLRSEGTSLRLRVPTGGRTTNTDGWTVKIGSLGKGQPELQIWYDRFSGYEERKLYACFFSNNRKNIKNLIKRISKEMYPIRNVSNRDIVETEIKKKDSFMFLQERLGRHEFNAPILEEYESGDTFFGIFDPTRDTADEINQNFCNRAVAFFEDVARAMSTAGISDEQHEVYPRHENRQQVRSHVQRERNRLLANDRKVMDKYTCQVCGMRFENVYGKELGRDYAEAHHLVPLHMLKGVVKTSLDDLRTVCANCHRMLHRMEGKREDITVLQKIVKRNR
jgi:5-methylcytosine-specific restriction endonuclease McrA